MYIKTQKFLILGLSKSGNAVAKYLLSNGAKCYIYDDLKNAKIDALINELVLLGAVNVNSENIAETLIKIDVLVISPGIPINHPIAVRAKELNKRIVGELEFGCLQFAPPIVAITGTNGKTTTSSIIDAIFCEERLKSMLVGNIGVPITSKIADINKDNVLITEVSSFQLESVFSFCPHIACVLNITPDHLERHYSMENYIYLKKRAFKNQRESEYLILNYDDKIVREFAKESRAKNIFISLKEKVDGGYKIEDKLYFFDEYIMNINDLALQGEHNVYNALFAISVAKLFNISNSSIVNAIKNFKGVRHRMEMIANKNGISFYNDSKATNTSSTMSALDSITAPTILILGGSEKGETYTDLFEKIKNSMVKHVVICGASRFNMLESAGRVGYSNITMTYDFETAVKVAKVVASEGDCVLLSPACASFDAFNNYEERGDYFRRIVEDF